MQSFLEPESTVELFGASWGQGQTSRVHFQRLGWLPEVSFLLARAEGSPQESSRGAIGGFRGGFEVRLVCI